MPGNTHKEHKSLGVQKMRERRAAAVAMNTLAEAPAEQAPKKSKKSKKDEEE